MKKILYSLLILVILTSCSSQNNTANAVTNLDTEERYAVISVDACDLSGEREPNIKVDIGVGDVEYWAYTNEYSQLVRVTAKEVLLQDDKTEPVNKEGRYCNDEARVPGTELKEYQQGHVLADSLKGNSSAYNITPQNGYLNMHGDQAYMEDQIREALKAGLNVTDFEAVITYPNTETQIPNHYKYTYKIDGRTIVDEFDNVDPRDVPIGEESQIAVPDFSDVNKFILNKNSKKIHKPTCEAAGKINEANKEEYFGNLNDFLGQGYETCKSCFK